MEETHKPALIHAQVPSCNLAPQRRCLSRPIPGYGGARGHAAAGKAAETPSAEAPRCAGCPGTETGTGQAGGRCPLVAREAEGFSSLAAGFGADYELFGMEFQMIA